MDRILEKLVLVPHVPGVYVMRDAGGHVIYIGKAKDLFKRLSSYFRRDVHDAKTTAMISCVANFEYFVCQTENDALGLESNLIKRHKPHYNILLKDNKSFPYIRITTDKFPYLEVTRKLKQRGKYFGPYFNGIWAKELLGVVQDIFGVRQCEHMGKEACLNYQIGKCPAPCVGKISQEDYGKHIENIKSFLKGEKDFGAREILTEKMEKAAELAQFELAIRYRNGLRFLDKLKERTITQVGRDVNCDVFACAERADVFVVSALTIRAGKLIGVQNFANQNDSPNTGEEKLQEFINQYYLENIRPDEVVTDAVRGYKKKLLDMAAQNAHEYIETSIEKINFKTQFTVGACEELQGVLGLSAVPKKIECFDASHIGGEGVVASMAVFVDGVAEKKLYRKFRIRHGLGNNDFMSINEVIIRRLKRLGGVDPSFGTAPDLIIVDGGKGQLTAALAAKESASNMVAIPPIIAFSEVNEIYLPDRSDAVVLDKRSYALRLLVRIRDEAHRFAIGYQKDLRARDSLR